MSLPPFPERLISAPHRHAEDRHPSIKLNVWIGDPVAIGSVRRPRKPAVRVSHEAQSNLMKLRQHMAIENSSCLKHKPKQPIG